MQAIGGGGAAPARKVIGWYDLVVFNNNGKGGEDGQRGVVARRLQGNMLGVRRADGVMFGASPGVLSVLDRSHLRPGDIVALESDCGGQIGVVTGASTALDLVRFEDDDDGRPAAVPVAQGVAVSPGSEPEEVRRVTELVLGEYVVSGPWLGRVVEVSLDADVVFDDGAVCRLSAAAERKLAGQTGEHDDLWRGRQTNSVLYPGQRVGRRAGAASAFREARWIRGYWKPSRVWGTVSRVGVAGVLVHWVAAAECTGSSSPAPRAWQPNPGELARLPCPTAEASAWHVGDRCFFRRNDYAGDGDHAHGLAPTRRRRKRRTTVVRRPSTSRQKQQLQAESSSTMSVVAGTSTTVDVLWQDGTRQSGLPSRSLVLFAARTDHDFFPGQRVISRAAAGRERRSGIVRSFNCTDKTVRVSWFKPAAAATEVDDGGGEAVVSAYDLACDLDAGFFYGDVVVRRRHRTGTVPSGGDGRDLSWVGHIVDLCEDGQVQVRWGDGDMAKVLPHEIARVKQQSISEILPEIGDWSAGEEEEAASSAAASQQAQPGVAAAAAIAAAGSEEEDSSDDESESDIEADGPLVTTSTAVVEQSAGSPEPTAMEEDVVFEADGSSSTDVVKTGHDKPFPFPRFDVVQSPPDHHFLDSMGQGTAVGRKWTKRVQKEWKALEKGLPDTIYMRAFEDRMDLFRVAMVGATGTPYHDGLFFFDLHLPPSYPAEPPLVNYRSFGLRVNPNLYPSGTVCLSLLNTFGGQGSELWSPEASTILQVVVSIQGLVLTAQPYYNEYAYRAQAGTPVGQRNELPYSENAFLLSLQTMLHLLRRPPAGFEGFVGDHFRRHGRYVIRACEAYQDGCLAGTLDEEGRPTDGSRERPCSAGFRLALLNVMPCLVEAFASIK